MAESNAAYAKSFSLGVLLVLLYMGCVILLVISFSAYVLRTDWNASINASAGNVQDVDTLIYLVRQDTKLSDRVDHLQSLIAETNRSHLITASRLEVLRVNRSEIEQDLQRQLIDAEQHLAYSRDRMADTGNEDLFATVSPQTPIKALEGLSELQNVSFVPSVDATKQIEIRGRAQELSTEISNLNADLKRTVQEVRAAERELKLWEQERTHYQDEQEEELAALETLRQTLDLNSPHRARWDQLSATTWYNPMGRLVALPTILLTLIATIAAGALGTLVAYSRTSSRRKEALDGSSLLINVGEGIAAAIGVFLFAGAGMLVLSQGGGADGRLELSPFTVAFLAFLSGFMAESAFASIQRAGKQLFSSNQTDDKA